MKRKTIVSLMILFFFLIIWQVKAKSINDIVIYDNFVAPPANDDCSNATTLTVNPNFLCTVVTAGTVVDATASTVTSDANSCPNSTTDANEDVWFKFVATATDHKIELSNIVGNQTDLYHVIYDESSGACNSLGLPIFCSDPNTSDLSGLTIGNTYIIRVYTKSSTAGADTTFDICVGSASSAPSNDDCANADAITLPFTPAQYDATGATNNDGFITATGCIDMNDGVWFTVAGNGDEITVKVTPDAWDAAIAVYEGSCGALVCVKDSNIGGLGVVEAAVFNSTSSTTYYVNVAFPSGTVDQSEGVFDLDVTSITLSLDDIIAKGFYYYPNPVKNVLKLSAKEPITQISLYSVLGREIKEIKQSDLSDLSAEIDFSKLPPGTYFVRAIVGGSSGSFKIIKD